MLSFDNLYGDAVGETGLARDDNRVTVGHAREQFVGVVEAAAEFDAASPASVRLVNLQR